MAVLFGISKTSHGCNGNGITSITLNILHLLLLLARKPSPLSIADTNSILATG